MSRFHTSIHAALVGVEAVAVAMATPVPELGAGVGQRIVVPLDPVVPARPGFETLRTDYGWEQNKQIYRNRFQLL